MKVKQMEVKTPFGTIKADPLTLHYIGMAMFAAMQMWGSEDLRYMSEDARKTEIAICDKLKRCGFYVDDEEEN